MRAELQGLNGGSKQIWLRLHRQDVIDFLSANGPEKTMDEFGMLPRTFNSFLVARSRPETSALLTLSSVANSKPLVNSHIRLLPDIAAAALKTRQDKELFIWACLRFLNVTGCGEMDYAQAMDGLIENCNYHPRTALRHFQLGLGKFYDIYQLRGRARIRIYGLKTVCEYLTIRLLIDKHWRDIPLDKLTTLASRRQAVYFTIHKVKGVRANPISRATIYSMTGISPRQQRRYDKRAVIRTFNFAVCPADNRGMAPVGEIPNIYHSKLSTGPVGMAKKVSRLLVGRVKSCIQGEALTFHRRYFPTAHKLAQAKQKDELSYVLVRNEKRLIPGRMEWEAVLSLC